MTLGQRIQEARKQAGLSQEALGEQLGVSRQAISKWEGDVTIPEIDKLIAMSRLFGQPVGVLLGVEPPADPAGPPPSQREQEVVEAILERYVAESQARRRPRKKWPLVLGGLALLLVFFNLFGRMGELHRQQDGLRNDLWRTTDRLTGSISGITAQMEDILERQNQVTAASSVEMTGLDYAAGTATFTLSATPRIQTPGMAVRFCALSGGEEVTGEGLPGPGGSYTATLTCPLTDTIALTATLLREGESQHQLLGEELGLLSQSYPDLYANSPIYGEQAKAGTPFHWVHPISIRVSPAQVKPIGPGQSAFTVSVAAMDLYLFVNDTLLWTVDEVDMSLVWQDTPGAVERRGFPMDLTLSLKPGDTLTLAAMATDSLGRTWPTVLDAMVVEADGQIFPTDYPDLSELSFP